MKNIKTLISLFVIVVFLVSGCDDYNKLTAPVTGPVNGGADLTRYVAIGNSITAGYQSGTIFESAQIYSYGNLIAQQMNTPYQMPLVSDPGAGGRLEISLTGSIAPNPNSGVPLNLNYPAPYNNLGVPGALVYDVLFATNSNDCASAIFAGIPNPFFDLILRNSALNLGTQLQQALIQQPTFVTLWIGNNDVLGYATSGGTAPSAPTDATQFGQIYTGIAGTLAQSGVDVVVANIPNVTAIPFFTFIGPQVSQAVTWYQLALLGAPGMFYQKAGETIGTGIADSLSLFTGGNLITLRAASYVPLLGQPTGKFYRDNGIAIPAGIDTTQPFGFHPQNPFPNSLILDENEITIANNAVAAYNSTMAALAQNFGFGLVDINKLFNDVRANDFNGGTNYNGVAFFTNHPDPSIGYVGGGLFSLDGVHPSSRGQAILANEFIKVINSKFSANIPLVDVSTIPGSIIFAGKKNASGYYLPAYSKNAFDHLLF